jgi:menaquinone-dependent protoporphyrinogen oxidase
MPRALIAYSTVDGHTLKICRRVQQVLEGSDRSAMLFDIGSDQVPDLAPFDIIVIGASVRYGKHRPALYRFIESNRQTLDSKPSAFFSVSVVARKAGKDTPESNPYIRAFRRKTTWAPMQVGVFAGTIDYPRYSFMDRQVIRAIMWLTHGPTNPHACVEFTDWASVEVFGQRIASL